MSSAKVGDTIPDATLQTIPWDPSLEDGKACGAPMKVNTHKEWKGKKIVVVAVPGAFTPTCHVKHLPEFVQRAGEFKQKGYEVYIIAANDVFVMSAWGRTEGGKDGLQFASDVNLDFSRGLGATLDLSGAGFGERTARYALIANDLKITYFAVEEGSSEVNVSSASTVLGKL
ncbi:Redoxin [Tilletiaria anomala UBC 951]|uniref:Putative peroxiredoxin n=1 Tax=Tilletiaria anomala (strain ATCC 24038 / CBS 436.72 / UBC 951) TaxID=1037660 RepID=A0A066VDY4_TILAU|nr:Redoxin [Tilletiaria anomala UBC 951]KDN39937.1 Redoxin [Tilletiaria anomala UBC 951]